MQHKGFFATNVCVCWSEGIRCAQNGSHWGLFSSSGGKTVNKAELIEALAARLGDRKTATAALDAVISEVQNAVTKGDKVAITGFGSFEKRVRNARTARNPRTGEAVKVKKTSVPAFRPGTAFREMVASGKVAKAAPAKKTAAAKATKTAAAKTHEVSAEFVSFDAAKKTLTVKTDAGEQTSPAQGKALTSAKAFKAGDKVVVTCKDNAAGEHEAAIAIKKAPAAKS